VAAVAAGAVPVAADEVVAVEAVGAVAGVAVDEAAASPTTPIANPAALASA
jgi:hypothetical protein